MAEWAAVLLLLDHKARRSLTAAMRLPRSLTSLGGTHLHVQNAMRVAGRKAIKAIRQDARAKAIVRWVKTTGVRIDAERIYEAHDAARAARSADSLAEQWTAYRTNALREGATEEQALAIAHESIESSVERTAVTEVADALNAEIARANAQARARGYVVIETWNATLDTRTCDACGDLHGEQRRSPHHFDPPPVHPRCRCVIDTEIESA